MRDAFDIKSNTPGRRESSRPRRASARITDELKSEYAWERELTSPIKLPERRDYRAEVKKFVQLSSRLIKQRVQWAQKVIKTRRITFNDRTRVVVFAGLGLLLFFAAGQALLRVTSTPSDSSDENETSVQGATAVKPEFKPVLPDGSEKATDSGQVRYSPDRKVASYTDRIGGEPITVSQQELPSSFKDDTASELKKLAESIYAKEEIKTNGLTAYLGNSIKGPQTVVFAKNGLLIFLKSDKKIDNESWAAYIEELQ